MAAAMVAATAAKVVAAWVVARSPIHCAPASTVWAAVAAVAVVDVTRAVVNAPAVVAVVMAAVAAAWAGAVAQVAVAAKAAVNVAQRVPRAAATKAALRTLVQLVPCRAAVLKKRPSGRFLLPTLHCKA
jgi:hypothetical protein